MTSEDLSTWYEVDPWPGAGASAVSVAGNAYFVTTAAASTMDNYAYSSDGDSWTLDTSTPALQDVVWDGSAFFAVSQNASTPYTAATADDTWTSVGSTGTSGVLRAAVFGKGVIVGCLTTGIGNPAIFWSDDGGSTWDNHTPTNNPAGVYDVVFGGGRFVAVRPRTSSGADDNVLTSTSGTSWGPVNIGTNDLFFYRVEYGNGIYVAVGTDITGATRTMTSSDGSSWTVHTPSGLFTTGLFQTHGLAFWAGKFALVNPLSGTVYTSTDGQSWTGQVFADRDWRGVAAGFAQPPRRYGWSVGMVRGRRG